MKKKLNIQRLLIGFCLLVMASVFGNQSNAQDQVIGTFPGMQGGFEKDVTGNLAVNLIAAGTQTTAWTVSASASATFSINTSTARTGSRFFQLGSTASNARRWQTPTVPDGNTAAGIQNGTTYIIQYYYRTSGTTDITNLAAQLTTDGGTGGASTGTAPMTATNGVWTKAVVSITSSTTSTANPRYGVGGLRANPGTTVNIDIDDYVVYQGTAVDETAPDASTDFAATPASNQIGVSWTAPAAGVDGGGYLVVRHTADPTTAPNANGIYAVGNSIGSGTVVYIGAGTSFTDTGLSTSTTYYYRVYTVDKAFNYSAALSGSATATAAGYAAEPTAQVTGLNLSVSTSGMTINWTPAVSGGGTNHLVVIGTSLSGDPVDGSGYTANTDFSNAGSSSLAGGKVVYNGTGNSVTVTGLTYNTTYSVRVYDFNGSAGMENYLTTSPASGSQTTDKRTLTSMQDGDFKTGATWVGGVAPTLDDNAVVAHNLVVNGSNGGSCYNLTINSGAKLSGYHSNATGVAAYLNVYGNSVQVDGTLEALAGPTETNTTSLTFYQNCTLSGSGSVAINRIRPGANVTNAVFTFDADANIVNTSAAFIFDNSGNSNIESPLINPIFQKVEKCIIWGFLYVIILVANEITLISILQHIFTI